jgi:hypothetical protein
MALYFVIGTDRKINSKSSKSLVLSVIIILYLHFFGRGSKINKEEKCTGH